MSTPPRRTFPFTAAEPVPLWDGLDDTIESSFPASDPPSSIPNPTYAPDPTDARESSADSGSALWGEGRLARAIEEQTAKLPPDTFLWAAVGSIGASAALRLAGKRHASLFIGQWAPVFLLLGIYSTVVKQFGPDRYDLP